MDFQTITLLILGIVLILVILVVAGLSLSARSFTQLVELTRFFGSQLAQHNRVPPQAPTTSLPEAESDTHSAPQENTPTTPAVDK